MVLNLKCPSCGHSQRASEEVLGQKIVCPSCGAGFRVSALKPRADAPAPPAIQPQASAAPGPAPRPPQPRPQPMPVHGGAVPAGAPTAGPSPSLPPWIYAALGGVGVLALIGVVLLGRLVMGIGAGQPANPADNGRVAAAGPESPPTTACAGPGRPGPDRYPIPQ